jgi:hypothetical protein
MTKITIDRSTVEQALEAQKALLSLVEDPCPYDAATTRAAARASITALKAALAEPQEPDPTYKLIGCVQHDCEECQRRAQRKPLTDDQLDDIAVVARRGNLYDLRMAIERAHEIGGKE